MRRGPRRRRSNDSAASRCLASAHGCPGLRPDVQPGSLNLAAAAILATGAGAARVGAGTAVGIVISEVLAQPAALGLAGCAHRATTEAGIGEDEVERDHIEHERALQSVHDGVVAAAA